jgi:hypothetical protein
MRARHRAQQFSLGLVQFLVTDSIFLHIEEKQQESEDDTSCRNYETANGSERNRVEYSVSHAGIDRLNRDRVDSPNAKTEHSRQRIR